MDADETRVNRLSERVIGCAFQAINTLGIGFPKKVDSAHGAQCINYLKATGLRLCLFLNFEKSRLEIQRFASGL